MPKVITAVPRVSVEHGDRDRVLRDSDSNAFAIENPFSGTRSLGKV